jgi:hypothetical protein
VQMFHITIGQRGAPRLDFEAVADDACTAAAQHLKLAAVGERVEVTPLASELQQLADSIKANPSADTRRLNRPASEFQREASPKDRHHLDDGGSYGMRCALCGGPADKFTCARCDEAGGAL